MDLTTNNLHIRVRNEEMLLRFRPYSVNLRWLLLNTRNRSVSSPTRLLQQQLMQLGS